MASAAIGAAMVAAGVYGARAFTRRYFLTRDHLMVHAALQKGVAPSAMPPPPVFETLRHMLPSKASQLYGSEGATSTDFSTLYPGSFHMTMTSDEAALILGVTRSSSSEEINLSYKRVLRYNHPDTGGSKYLAQKINQARDTLLAGR